MAQHTFTAVCRVDDVARGSAKVVEFHGIAVGVFHLDNGEWCAIGNVCTHEESSLADGEIEDDTVYCPKHGAQFNLRTGAAMTLPAIVAEPAFDVRVENGEVQLAPRA